MSSVALITGAGSGVGKESAIELAKNEYTVYASMRDIDGHNKEKAAALKDLANKNYWNLETIELDVKSAESIEKAVDTILQDQTNIDVVIHNAAQSCWGVSEAFSAGQISRLLDTNVIGPHRINKAVLPHMREQNSGLLLYIGSTTTQMIYPYQGPYQASKAAMDSMAQVTRYEVARYGIDVVVLTPGAIMEGTEHFKKGMSPADKNTAASYSRIADVGDQIINKLVALTPKDYSAKTVGKEVARIVSLPHGSRSFRYMLDALNDGAAEVNQIADIMQSVLMERLGLRDLLYPTTDKS